MGWLVLALLTLFAFVDALAIARRATPDGRAELGMVTMAAFFGLLGAPVLVLGYSNQLTPLKLGVTALALFAGVFVLFARKVGAREELRACRASLALLASIPGAAVRETARARSPVFVGVVWSGGLIAMSLVLVYFVSFCTWDGFLYHEPIVGFALQNQGFAAVSLPPAQAVQAANGYPRLCEALSLWFVAFTDRTLIELPNTLAAPPMMLCVFALGRRFTDRVTSMGLAVVLLLIPHAWHNLCATYIDVQVTFFLLFAMHYASRPLLGVRHAWLATLGMALALASKQSSLAWVPVIALIAYGRLAWHEWRSRRSAVILASLGGGAALVAIGAFTLVRNWIEFKDPLWPVSYTNRALGIEWRGLATVSQALGHTPPRRVFELAYEPPQGGMTDIIRRSYGMAIAWVAFPIGAIAVAAACVAGLREALRRERGPALGLWMILAPAIVSILTTPGLEQPRYILHALAAMLVACAWLLRRRAWTRAREGAVAVAIALSIIPFFWAGDAEWTTREELRDRLGHPLAERAYSQSPPFDFLTRQRFEEIGPGDRVVCTEGFDFIGAAWNFDFSNRVEYIPFSDKTHFLARIAALEPKWIYVGPSSPAHAALESTGQWELVGRALAASDAVALRRTRHK
jgi:hypothetical protein